MGRVIRERGEWGGTGTRGRFIQSWSSERGGPRARPRYPGVESVDHRTKTRRETHPYLSGEEEEEVSFKAGAVNEEDSERDRTTLVYKTSFAGGGG